MQGELSRFFFCKKKRLNQKKFSDGGDFPLRYFFGFSNPENSAKSLPDGNRDHMLAEGRSELMKQECKVDSLNTCIRELQQQTCAQRLELEDAHLGYEESRRESKFDYRKNRS